MPTTEPAKTNTTPTKVVMVDIFSYFTPLSNRSVVFLPHFCRKNAGIDRPATMHITNGMLNLTNNLQMRRHNLVQLCIYYRIIIGE